MFQLPSSHPLPITTLFRSIVLVACANNCALPESSNISRKDLSLRKFIVSVHFYARPVSTAGGYLVVICFLGLIQLIVMPRDRKSTRLNSSHANISYAVFCL